MKLRNGEKYCLPIIYINQINLHEDMEKQLNLKTVKEDLKKAKEIIELNDRQISNELKELDFGAKLQMVHTTKELYLNQNKINDLSFIKGMQALAILHANSNEIEEMGEIPSCLEELVLMNNKIDKIGNLINAKQLQILNLGSNKISKIENIEHLEKLSRLYLACNQIEKIEGLPKSLVKLGLNSNKIKRMENLSHLT